VVEAEGGQGAFGEAAALDAPPEPGAELKFGEVPCTEKSVARP